MSGLAPFWIDPNNDKAEFPDVSLALSEPDGLLAIGGNLSSRRLIDAYRHGIFPWYSQGQPILWWSPDPRAVLFPKHLKISRSLRKEIIKNRLNITLDQAFAKVVSACAEPRASSQGTWITPAMYRAYCQLHDLGLAHSVEAWQQGKLVGGLYGVAIGRIFFGESMFSRVTSASKVAFAYLVRQLEQWGYALVDCQVHSKHLDSLGATKLARDEFIAILDQWRDTPGHPNPWHLELTWKKIITIKDGIEL